LNQDSVSRETWARLDASSRASSAPGDDEPDRAVHDPDDLDRARCRFAAAAAARAGAKRWIDFGSGAAFPDWRSPAHWSNHGRQFIWSRAPRRRPLPARSVDALHLPAIVHAQRIEDFTRSNKLRFEVVRRVRSRPGKLLGYANPLLKTGRSGCFQRDKM
jgi:hypothetical protein